MIRSDTAHSAHIHGYQHITIYVHSAFATNASLSILSVQSCMHPHTTQRPLTYTYALSATYITTYVLLNQRHYIQMIISRSKEFVDHNHCKAKLHKISKNCPSEKFHAMHVVHTVRTYLIPCRMKKTCYNSAYNRLSIDTHMKYIYVCMCILCILCT